MKNVTDFRKTVETGVDPRLERNDSLKYVCSRRLHSMTTRPQCQYSTMYCRTASKWPGILKLRLKSVKNL